MNTTTLYAYIGNALFEVISCYQVGLLFLLLIGNFFVFSFYIFLLFQNKTKRLRFRWGWILLEIIYLFFNPIMYLTTIQAFWTNRYLNILAIFCLISYWGTRLCIPFQNISHRLKSFVQWNLVVSLAILIIFTVKDTTYFVKYVWGAIPGGKFYMDLFESPYAGGSLLLFYIIPLLMLIIQLRKAFALKYWSYEPSYLLLAKHSFMIYIPIILGIVVILCALPFQRHYRENDIQNTLLKYRPSILQASQIYNIAPRLIASIIYVNHHEYISPLRYHFENLLMDIWLRDLSSHYGLSETLNISIGLAQIKPVTAISAITIPCWNTDEKSCYSKLARDVPTTLRENWILTPPITVNSPMPFSSLDKHQLVADLFTPEKSIEYCAYILSLYALQWETTHPEWSIRNRPDILATLYQIGFEHSHPKAQPRANTFGKRVQKVYETAWMIQHFQEQRLSYLKSKTD